MAEAGRGVGLDVVSVHEVGRRGLSDPHQMRLAADEGRVVVTANRDDFLHLTAEFYRKGEPHSGVLIVPRSLYRGGPQRVAHALKSWEESKEGYPESFGAYVVEFLAP